MPERLSNGETVLSSQGLPFAVVGVREDSSLLALFRCVSVRYRFSTDVHKPAPMGCVGRVFSSMEVRRLVSLVGPSCDWDSCAAI